MFTAKTIKSHDDNGIHCYELGVINYPMVAKCIYLCRNVLVRNINVLVRTYIPYYIPKYDSDTRSSYASRVMASILLLYYVILSCLTIPWGAQAQGKTDRRLLWLHLTLSFQVVATIMAVCQFNVDPDPYHTDSA